MLLNGMPSLIELYHYKKVGQELLEHKHITETCYAWMEGDTLVNPI